MLSSEQIGINAGIVWRELNKTTTPQSFDFLESATQLSAIQLAAAIGWLAREDKISFSEADGVILYSLTPINIYF